MDTRELEHILFEELGYADSPGLLQGDSIPWLNGRAIPDINAAFFLENVPVAYFSRLIELDLDKIRQLHKNVWSQSKTPLLFVILPHEIRIYNGYDPTPSQSDEFDTSTRLLRKLERLTDELVACEAIRSQLVESHYERVYLETGAFWDTTEGQRVSHEGRADHRLVESMRQMRRLLIEEGLSNHVAYALLGRSVLIRYLEDRGALTPGWISRLTDGRADSYCDALADRFTTYLLFEQLSQRFDGDLFPVEGEEDTVSEVHLEVLRSFLSGTDLQTGQMSLLPYNFEYIPIELISNIYDIFLDDRRAAGAYYTPLLLADLSKRLWVPILFTPI